MPLLDHFHAPVSERRSWEGFHSLWAAAMVEQLNRDVLAEEYFADMHVHVGSQVEVDVATLEETPGSTVPRGTADRAVWTPPPPAMTVPAVFPDDIEVQVYATAAGPTLVAAIELVSPGNKDRAEARRAFAAKCVGYLTRGIGLVVVDVVTNRLANLHGDIIAELGLGHDAVIGPQASTYAVAYRPSRKPEGDRIEIWPAPLKVGDVLPVLPLALRNAETVPLDLEAAYLQACERSRLRMAA
jgi:hypothetical protein